MFGLDLNTSYTWFIKKSLVRVDKGKGKGKGIDNCDFMSAG